MNVKWANIVFVLRYGDETLHLWKPLLNTNVQRGSSQCLTKRNTIFVHFTFMFSIYRKFLKSSEIVYNRLEIKNDIAKERRGLRHDVVYEVFCFGLG